MQKNNLNRFVKATTIILAGSIILSGCNETYKTRTRLKGELVSMQSVLNERQQEIEELKDENSFLMKVAESNVKEEGVESVIMASRTSNKPLNIMAGNQARKVQTETIVVPTMVAPTIVEQAIVEPTMIKPTMLKPTMETKRTKGPVDFSAPNGFSDTGSYGIHIASYKVYDNAVTGWKKVHDKHPDLYAGGFAKLMELDLPSLGGTYYRLKVGPFDTAKEASNFCVQLEKRGEFCKVSPFDGQKLQ